MAGSQGTPGSGVLARGRAVREGEGASRHRPAREPAARTYARALPVVPVRARGLTIEGADGRRYLDCASGAGSALGHNHPAVLEAIRRVLDSGAPLQVMNLTTPVEDAFVTELLRTLPPGLADHARVRFCGPSGTDPLDTAAALVRAATGRDRTVAAHRWVPDDGGPGRARPAGVFLEPAGSAAEVRPVPDTVVRRLRALTAERAVPLVVDERETGVGRTGAFWAVDDSGAVPDVLILAKAIGGSLPLAAVVHRATSTSRTTHPLQDPRAVASAATSSPWPRARPRSRTSANTASPSTPPRSAPGRWPGCAPWPSGSRASPTCGGGV